MIKACGILGILFNLLGTVMAIWNLLSAPKKKIQAANKWESIRNADYSEAEQKSYGIVGICIIIIGAVYQTINMLEPRVSHCALVVMMIVTACVIALLFWLRNRIVKWLLK